jgi:glycosyltransferase involved in cell wall biosynthesis
MVHLGIIARCDNTGLASQTWEYVRHLSPAKILVIDVSRYADQGDHCNKHAHRERFDDLENVTYFENWVPSESVCMRFLDGLDTVLSAETMYNPNMCHYAKRNNVKTVVAPNWEFFDPGLKPSLYIPPTTWHIESMGPTKVIHMPNPVDTDRVKMREDLPKTAQHLIHMVGRPAVHDRNGTEFFLEALRKMVTPIKATIRCQDPSYVRGLNTQMPDHVTLEVDNRNVPNYWNNYEDGDLLVMPRRYGGQCMPAQEAVAAGIPTIMTNISPNDDWLPQSWLIPATQTGAFRAKQFVDIYTPHTDALALKMQLMASNEEAYAEAKKKARQRRHRLSWDTLKEPFESLLVP